MTSALLTLTSATLGYSRDMFGGISSPESVQLGHMGTGANHTGQNILC